MPKFIFLSAVSLFILTSSGFAQNAEDIYQINQEFKDPLNIHGNVKELTYFNYSLDSVNKFNILKEKLNWHFDKKQNITSKTTSFLSAWGKENKIYDMEEKYFYANGELKKILAQEAKDNYHDSTLYYYNKKTKEIRILKSGLHKTIRIQNNLKLELDTIFGSRKPESILKEYEDYNGTYKLTKQTPGDAGYLIEKTYNYQKNKLLKETVSLTKKDKINDLKIQTILNYNKNGIRISDSIFQTSFNRIPEKSKPITYQAADSDEMTIPAEIEYKIEEETTIYVYYYSYNKTGDLIGFRSTAAAGPDKKPDAVRYEIKYDKNKNWVEVIESSYGGSSYSKYTREIIYY